MKDPGTQQCYFALLEKLKWAFDSGQMYGALLLMDLSKPFDCLDHELPITYAYWLQN